MNFEKVQSHLRVAFSILSERHGEKIVNKREERNNIERQKILAAIEECSARLGHVPSVIELEQQSKIRRRQVRRLFGSYARALRECKLQPSGPGHKLTIEELFRDWAGVVRKVGKLPSIAEYESLGKYSQGPLTRRFASWLDVPKAMKKFVEQQDWAEEWKDVLEIIGKDDGTAKRGVKKLGPWNVLRAGRPKPFECVWTANPVEGDVARTYKRSRRDGSVWHAGGRAGFYRYDGADGLSGLRGDAAAGR
jgi:hypothetical protein